MTVPRAASWPASECTAASAGAIAIPATKISAPSETHAGGEHERSGARRERGQQHDHPPAGVLGPAARRLATTPPMRLPSPQMPSTKPVALGVPVALAQRGHGDLDDADAGADHASSSPAASARRRRRARRPARARGRAPAATRARRAVAANIAAPSSPNSAARERRGGDRDQPADARHDQDRPGDVDRLEHGGLAGEQDVARGRVVERLVPQRAHRRAERRLCGAGERRERDDRRHARRRRAARRSRPSAVA